MAGGGNASPFGQIMPCAGSGPARLVVTHRGRDWRLPGRCVTPRALATNVHRLGYAALGFGRPQRCWRSLRRRARSRRWAASTPGWRAWALRQRTSPVQHSGLFASGHDQPSRASGSPSRSRCSALTSAHDGWPRSVITGRPSSGGSSRYSPSTRSCARSRAAVSRATLAR